MIFIALSLFFQAALWADIRSGERQELKNRNQDGNERENAIFEEKNDEKADFLETPSFQITKSDETTFGNPAQNVSTNNGSFKSDEICP